MTLVTRTRRFSNRPQRWPRSWLRTTASTACGVAASALLIRLFLERPLWWGSQPELVSQWTQSLLLIWIAAAAVAAWVAVPIWSSRMGDRQQLAVKGKGRSSAAIILFTGLIQSVFSILVLLGLATVNPDQHLASENPQVLVLWVLSCIVVGFVFAGLGVGCAAVIRRTPAIAVAPCLAYLVTVIPISTLDSPPWDNLLPGPARTWLYAMPDAVSAGLRLGFWVAVLLAVLFALHASRFFTSLSLVIAISLFTVSAVKGPDFQEHFAAHEVCTYGEGTRVCASRVFEPGAQKVAAILAPVFDKLPASYRPQVIDAEGRVPEGTDQLQLLKNGILPLAPSSGNSSPTNLPNPDETIGAAISSALFGVSICDEGKPGIAASYGTALWMKSQLELSARAYGYDDVVVAPDGDSREWQEVEQFARSLSAMPSNQRSAFLSSHRTELQACTLEASNP